MDLIRSDKSLAKYAKRNGQGLITFEGEGEILANAKANSNSAQATSDVAQIRANNANLKSSRTQLLRDANLDLGEKF
jgi:hypothetical protein